MIETTASTVKELTTELRHQTMLWNANTRLARSNFRYALPVDDLQRRVAFRAWVAYRGILWVMASGRVTAEITLWLRQMTAWQMCAFIAEVTLGSTGTTMADAYDYIRTSDVQARAVAWCKASDAKVRENTKRINGC